MPTMVEEERSVDQPNMPTPEVSPEIQEKLGQGLGKYVCNVDVTVHEWTGRLKIPREDLKIQVKTDDGQFKEMETDKVTANQLILDDHEVFKAIKANGATFDGILRRFTCGSSKKGVHLVSTFRVGDLSLEFNRLLTARLELAKQAERLWWDEIVPGMRAKYPDVFEQFVDKLPNPRQFQQRFGVDWEFQPLNPLAGEDLDLSNLSRSDRELVIARTNQMVEQRARSAFEGVIQQVFGEVAEICDDVVKGSFDSGKRRQAALNEILMTMDRLLNFRHLADGAVVAQVEAAKKKLQTVKITDWNSNVGSVREAVKVTMGELSGAVKKLMSGYGVTTRSRNLDLD